MNERKRRGSCTLDVCTAQTTQDALGPIYTPPFPPHSGITLDPNALEKPFGAMHNSCDLAVGGGSRGRGDSVGAVPPGMLTQAGRGAPLFLPPTASQCSSVRSVQHADRGNMAGRCTSLLLGSNHACLVIDMFLCACSTAERKQARPAGCRLGHPSGFDLPSDPRSAAAKLPSRTCTTTPFPFPSSRVAVAGTGRNWYPVPPPRPQRNSAKCPSPQLPSGLRPRVDHEPPSLPASSFQARLNPEQL
jgi:hypothetical protein